MEHINHNRLPITAGLLTLPNSDTQKWFNIFVLEDSLHLEIQDWANYTYSAPVFLLKDAESRGYGLPEVAVQVMEQFTQSGGRVIEAMVASIKAEMRDIARRPERESQWLAKPEELIWRLVKIHVPEDIQLAVFALLKPYRHYFDDDGKIEIKRIET